MAKRVHTMEQVVASARAAITMVAGYMSQYANHCRRDLVIDVRSFAWLSKENLSLHPGLTWKLATKFARPFRVMK